MFKVIEMVDGGWSAETDEGLVCQHCMQEVDEQDFFWCDVRHKVYCARCVRDLPNIVCSRTNGRFGGHSDWHIIRVDKTNDGGVK